MGDGRSEKKKKVSKAGTFSFNFHWDLRRLVTVFLLHFSPLFVTWKIGQSKKLRGCIGTFAALKLHSGKEAISSAHRFGDEFNAFILNSQAYVSMPLRVRSTILGSRQLYVMNFQD